MTSKDSQIKEVGLLTAFTLVLWLSCLAVGSIGIWVQTHHPPVPATQPAVEQVTTMDVDVLKDAPTPDDSTVEPTEAAIPLAPAVALASPAIAFALPTDRPVRIVAPVQKVATQTPAVVRLTPGQGEGFRPMPDYPPEARLARQQGSLIVTLTVGEDGKVISARISTPCPWPMLNQAALRRVREEWRFPPGPVRQYEAPFEFKLTGQ